MALSWEELGQEIPDHKKFNTMRILGVYKYT